MPSRVFWSLAIVIVALSAERFGHYGQFMFMAVTTHDLFNMSAADIGTMYAAATLAHVVGTLAAGGAAFVVAPRITAAVGALTATLGLGLFALASSENMVWLAICVEGFGSGLVYVSALAYAARVLTYEGETDAAPPSLRRFLTLGCFVASAGVAVNIAAAFASVIGLLRDAFGTRGSTLVAAAATFSCAALFVTSMLVDRDQVAPSNAPPANIAYRTGPSAGGVPAAPTNPRPIAVALALSAPLTIMSLVGAASFAFTMEQSVSARSIAQAAQTSMAVVAGVGVAVLLGVLASKRSALSLFRFIGVGFVVFAVGALLLLPRAASAPATSLMGLSSPLAGLCTVLAALAVRGRGATMVIASILTVEAVGTMLSGLAMSSPTASTAGGAALLIVSGVALFVLDKPLQATFVL